ncbi:hypothetical protein C8J57DRAFT_1510211 [Mycena rebaudengoi]|nr:hypothetical protein C8J57DRAFT_1510211 [Mycena rebaudengoi]
MSYSTETVRSQSPHERERLPSETKQMIRAEIDTRLRCPFPETREPSALEVDDAESNLFYARAVHVDHEAHIDTVNTWLLGADKIQSGLWLDVSALSHQLAVAWLQAQTADKIITYKRSIVSSRCKLPVEVLADILDLALQLTTAPERY